MKLMPFQQVGARFLSERRSAYLGDEMGLGKTVQALGALNLLPDWLEVLVVCPASAKMNWVRESEKWLDRPYYIDVAWGSDVPDAEILIINWDILHRNLDKLSQKTWDVVIFDEAQRLGNDESLRTQASGAIPAKRRWFMSGTPVMDRPAQLWPIMQAMGIKMKWTNFIRRYCNAYQDGFYRWQYYGASNLEELGEKLSPYFLRRLKSKVMPDLPPIRRTVVEIGQGAKYEHTSEFKEAVRLLKGSKDADLDMGAQSTIRKLIGIEKIKPATDFINDLLPNGKKHIVFAYHREVLETLHATFSDKSVLLYGGTASKKRQAIVDQFQNDPKCRIFFGQVSAAGEAITLTASSHILNVEFDWSHGVMAQSECRAHRFGQTDRVLVQYLALADSLDARIAKALISKQKIADAILGWSKSN